MRLFLLFLLLSLPLGAQSVALVNGTIVDGTGAAPYSGTVVIEGDRIIAAGPQVEAPAAAEIIDASGKTILPGLFDLHTHLSYSAAPRYSGDWPQHVAAYLYSGVTSVVDLGSYPEQFAPLRKLLDTGAVLGPRIHFAVRLAPPMGHGLEGGRGDYFSREVLTPADARAVIEDLEQYQPDAIKLFTDGWRYGYADPMTSMTADTIAAATAAAHERGWEVVTHTVTVQGAEDAAAGKVNVIDHGVSDAPVSGKLIALMKENGVTYAPTLAVYHPKGRDILDPLLDAVVPPAARANVDPPLTPPTAETQLVRGYSDPDSPRARRWSHLVANNQILHAAGVTFGAGTDAGVSNTWHGWSTQRELQLLVHAGLSPLEALTAATGHSAQALNVDDERGTVAAGKLADLLLINGAPHERIAEIARLERVWLGGREIDREALRTLIASPDPTPLPAIKPPALLDDFEAPGRRSSLGTNWMNLTDAGLAHAAMSFQRTARPDGGHALTVLVHMSQEKDTWGAVVLPLTPGQINPADLSDYQGVQFEARGEGDYTLEVDTKRSRAYDYPSAPFEAHAAWKQIRIPFAELGSEAPADATALLFRVRRQAGEQAWLELDNIRLY